MSRSGTMHAGNATSLASTMPLTSSRAVGRFRSSRASNQSAYTLFPPSDGPTNHDHLSVYFCDADVPGERRLVPAEIVQLRSNERAKLGIAQAFGKRLPARIWD